MGVIKRQGIKYSIVNYVGVLVGMLSTLWIYPLQEEAYGLWLVLNNLSMLIVPFVSVGISSLPTRYFPEFNNDKNGHNGFLGFLILAAGTLFISIGLIFSFFPSLVINVLNWLNFPSPIIKDYLLIIVLLSFSHLINGLLINYVSNFQRITVPKILNNFSLKIILPLLILLLVWGKINLSQYIITLTIIHFIILISLFVYTSILKQLHLKINFKFFTRERLKSMGTYSLYGVLGSIGTLLATRIDTIMISSLIDISSSGIYGLAANIAIVIAIPFEAFIKISSPIIANSMFHEKLEKVKEIYTQSSLGLMIIGLSIGLAIWGSIDNLFALSSKTEILMQGKFVILFLGLAKIIDMTTGLNEHIIAFSKYFRFNFLAFSILGLLNIYFNIIFIKSFGLVGAAIATLTSITIYNTAKALFIWFKFKMHPFSKNHLYTLALGVTIFLLIPYLPNTGVVILDLAIRSTLILLLFLGPVYYYKLSPTINELIIQGIQMIKKYLSI